MVLDKLKIKEVINPIIQELLLLNVDRDFRDTVNYQILTGGKRLRPALTIITHRMLGGKIKDILYPAAGLELLHNYSLIIDDIIDNGTLRRNKPTVWAKFGKSIAQCIGMDYAAAAFQGAVRSKKPAEISDVFSRSIKTLVEGEVLDILFEQRGRKEEKYVTENRYFEITNKDYLKMVRKKTSVLFQACCEVSGIISGAKDQEIKALSRYGLNFGIAFQIRDDILDIFGKENQFGKKIGKDIIERKLGNIVILLSLKELKTTDKKQFLEIIRKKEISKKDIKRAIALIKETKSYEKANKLGNEFANKAKENLKFLPQNKWNDILAELTNFTINRKI